MRIFITLKHVWGIHYEKITVRIMYHYFKLFLDSGKGNACICGGFC